MAIGKAPAAALRCSVARSAACQLVPRLDIATVQRLDSFAGRNRVDDARFTRVFRERTAALRDSSYSNNKLQRRVMTADPATLMLQGMAIGTCLLCFALSAVALM